MIVLLLNLRHFIGITQCYYTVFQPVPTSTSTYVLNIHTMILQRLDNATAINPKGEKKKKKKKRDFFYFPTTTLLTYTYHLSNTPV